MKHNRLSDILSNDVVEIRYFSLARHALIEALRVAGVGHGDKVLLPEFVCRDLLASISALGASACWYPIGRDLSPSTSPLTWPDAKVVLVINYFGFPQKLDAFYQYAANSGAIIIEDNAHGFLSRDENGQWLGARTRLGIFSLRKTFRMPDGAALFVNERRFQEKLAPQLSFSGKGYNRSEAIRLMLRRIPILGRSLVKAATNIVRLIRVVRYGTAAEPIGSISESELPISSPPWLGLSGALDAMDVVEETERRRSAYITMALMAAKLNIQPIFPNLPTNCVPYGFPFWANNGSFDGMRKFAAKEGYGIMPWPDLPSAIQAHAPAHYLDVRLVNFLC